MAEEIKKEAAEVKAPAAVKGKKKNAKAVLEMQSQEYLSKFKKV